MSLLGGARTSPPVHQFLVNTLGEVVCKQPYLSCHVFVYSWIAYECSFQPASLLLYRVSSAFQRFFAVLAKNFNVLSWSTSRYNIVLSHVNNIYKTGVKCVTFWNHVFWKFMSDNFLLHNLTGFLTRSTQTVSRSFFCVTFLQTTLVGLS